MLDSHSAYNKNTTPSRPCSADAELEYTSFTENQSLSNLDAIVWSSVYSNPEMSLNGGLFNLRPFPPASG